MNDAELLELCERTTDEPWVAEQMGSEGWTVRGTVVTTHRTWMRVLASNLSEADAKMIAEARAAIPRLLREKQESEAGLAAQMYRESLSDLNAESGDWPRGVECNLGDLDFDAEKLVRKAWASIPRERQIELERIVEAALAPDDSGGAEPEE